MISLQPQEQFAIVRQLADHTDSTTYYVRAVIRNSISNEIIDQVNLDDKSAGRFLKIWEVPADVSGLGFYIDITTSVYTDSDYSIKAPTYGDELEDYLVFDRIAKGGGGGGMDVDYKKIDKLLIAAIETIPGAKMESLEPIRKALEDVKKEIAGIEIPKPEKMNHTPVLEAIGKSLSTILKAIDNKKVTPETNLTEIQQKIGEILAKEPNLEGVYARITEVKKVLADYIQQENDGKEKTEETSKGKLEKLSEMILPILSGDMPMKSNIKKDRAAMLITHD